MLRVILWILVGYFVYRFVFNFLVPIFRVSRQMKRQVREFQSHMQQTQQNQYQAHSQQQASGQQRPTPPKEKAGDYIDFEEIK